MKLKLEFESFQDFASRLWPCLSEEGMWVQSEDPAGVGEVVDFDILLADGFRLFHGSGHVVSVGPGPADGPDGQGMMISFDHLDKPSKNLVRKVISKHQAEGGTKFEPMIPGQKVELIGSDDSDSAVEPTVLSAQPEPGVDDLFESVDGPEGGDGGETADLPFAEVDPDGEWSRDPEPELTSFLKPSDDSGTEIEAPGTEERSPVEPVAPTAPPSPDEAIADRADTIDLEAAEETLDEHSGTFEEAAGGSQPLAFDSGTGETDPLPSTYIPPTQVGDDLQIGGTEWDEAGAAELEEEWAAATVNSSWWPWVVIAVVGVGAGLFFAKQLGLGGWGPTREESAVAAGEPASSEIRSPPARPTSLAEEADDTARAAAADGVDAAEFDVAEEDAAGVEGEGIGAAADEAAAVAAFPDDEEAPTLSEPAAAAPPAVMDDAPPPPPGMPDAETANVGEVSPEADVPLIDPVRLDRITWRSEEGDTVVTLRFDRSPAAERIESLSVATGEPRYVVKIAGITGRVPSQVPIDSEHVRQLRFGKHRMAGGMELHVVADLVAASVEFIEPVEFDGSAMHLRFASRQ